MYRISTLLVVLILLPLLSFGQSNNKKSSIKEKMWQSGDPDFKLTKVPDKWKKESAVVLARSMEYQVRKELVLSLLDENLYTHQRIKLLDAAAVKEYSELSFESSRYYTDRRTVSEQIQIFVGVKVIKPNGEEREINTDDAVVMEAQSGRNSEKYNKLAIPNLEPGDIIDYYYCLEKRSTDGAFDRVMYPLAGKYPIVKQKMDLQIMRKCYLSAKSLNGAPELKRNESKDKDVYSLVLENTEKINTDQRWFYKYRSVPTINFRAYFIKGAKFGWQYFFIGKQGELHSKVTEENLLGYVNFVSENLSKKELPGSVVMLKFVNKNHRKEKDPAVLVREAYNHVRQIRYADTYEDELLNNTSYNYYYNYYRLQTNMMRFLKKKKISHDVILATPRNISDINDLVLGQDQLWLIRVNTPKPFYIGAFDRFSYYNEIDEVFQGTNAYAVNMQAKANKRTLEKIVLPAATAQDNNDLVTMEVTFSTDKPQQLKVKRSVDAKGMNRYAESAMVVTPYEYLENARLEKYGITKLSEKMFSRKAKADYKQKSDNRKEQDLKDREERIKSHLEEQLQAKVVDYNNFALLQTGMWESEGAVKYEDEFVLEGLLSKNGPNYMLEAGKLIGRQIALQKEEQKRKDDIFMPYARSYDYNISIKIPKGYEVRGLEQFNVDLTNSTGGFVSKAVMKDGKIVITTRKYYNHNYEKAEKWLEMVAFLEATYNFTQQKLLLRKTRA
jgi:hypothetical protein